MARVGSQALGQLLSVKLTVVLVAAVGLVLLVAPATGLLSAYWLRFLTNMFMWVGLAGSFNTLYGYGGRVDFGHVVFFGVGATVTAIGTVQFGLPWLPSIIIGGLLAVALAYVIGLPTLRLHGAYFAIATWALAEAIKQLALILNITGGTYGLSPPPVLSREMSYWLMLIMMIAMTVTNLVIQRSKFGYALRALSESETAAEVLGINTPRSLLYAFMISALFPAIIGGIYGLWIGYVYPYDAFDGFKTDQMVVMTLLGGMGSYLGPVIGAVLIISVFEVLWTYWTNVVYLIFLGALIVFAIVFLPGGMIGLAKTKRARAWLSKILPSRGTNRNE